MNSFLKNIDLKKLVAISKGRSIAQIMTLYELGVRDFGENRIQEALGKIAQLPSDIRWHFVGRLQSNKVSKAVGRFHLIHSVDNVELAKKISSYAIPQKVLLQVNTSGELSKAGLSATQWISSCKDVFALPFLDIEGLMTIAPNTEDHSFIRRCFQDLKTLQIQLQQITQKSLPVLSMGMSQDYQIALEEGATLIRLGRALFDYY